MEITPTTQEAKETFDPHSVVIFFPTYYENWNLSDNREENNADLARGDASISTITKAIDVGYRLVIVDGGSSTDYLDRLHKLGIDTLPQKEKGMARAKREALVVAAALEGAEVLLLMQPEKDDIIKDIPELVKPIRSGQADLVMPTREPNSFRQTCSAFQFKSESWANKWCNKIAHQTNIIPQEVDLDWFFGVKALKNDPELVEMFMRKYMIDDPVLSARKNMDPERYSDFDFFPVLAALTNGKKVVSIEVSFHYFESQKKIEEILSNQFKEKRKMQRRGILGEFVQYVRLLTGNSKNHLLPVMKQEMQSF